MRVQFCKSHFFGCATRVSVLLLTFLACSLAVAAGRSAAVVAGVPSAGCPQGSGSCFDPFAGALGTPLTLHNSDWKRASGVSGAYLTGNKTAAVLPGASAFYYLASSSSEASQITIPPSQNDTGHSRQVCVRMQSGIDGYCVAFGKVNNGMYSGCPLVKAGLYIGNGNCASPTAQVSHTLAISASGAGPVTLQIYLDGVRVGSVTDVSNVYAPGHPGFSLIGGSLGAAAVVATWRDSLEVVNAPVASAPVLHPAAGTYRAAQTISMISPTPGATVFYTTDGSTPTTASPWFKMPITIASSKTIRAIAYKPGDSPSAISSNSYTIAPSQVAPPVFSVPSPYSGLGTLVSISDATSGARILYCIDTANACIPSLPYISAIPFVSTGFIRAAAFADETLSAVTSWQGTWSSVQIGTTTCPAGTQYQAYAGCTITATGGVPPYTFGWSTSSGDGLVEGLQIDPMTGKITGTAYGQGTYAIPFTVTDFLRNTVTKTISIAVAGNNTTGGCSFFPSDTIWHLNVSSLPVDNSVAAPFLPVYAASSLHLVFGNSLDDGGMPFIRVPYNQANVPVSTTMYQSYFTSAPIPTYAPVESTENSGANGDRHVLVLQTAGGGNNCKLWEMWQGAPTSSGWTDSSNAYWDLGTYDMLPQGNGSTDAAGLPIAPLLYNYDEVAGTCASGAECGVVTHPGRLTLNHTLNYHVWPATSQSGLSACSGGYEDDNHLLSQSNPPVQCGATSPMGEIYRLKSGTATPAACVGHPQAQVLITAMRNYGLIIADNGITGGIVATADSRWNDADLACLTSLTLSDFEPVNVSSKMIDVNSSQVRQ